MKKLLCSAMALMTAVLFVGCGPKNTGTDANGMVTEQTTTQPSIVTEPIATTPPVTTMPDTTTMPEMTTVPDMIEDMTDAMDDIMDGTDNTTTGSERSANRDRTKPAR